MIKVGIIGTGIIAREHAAAIAMIPQDAVLVAAADVSAERLNSFCDTYKVERRYASAAELIADPQVQLVAVATPPSLHEEAVVAALDAGKYVLCEKPLAQSLESAAQIAAAEARHPGKLSVSYQLRYAPRYQRMLWLIEKGWIGEPQSASVERHGYIPHSLVGKGGWWGAWNVAGGGVLMTQMIHELDIMLLAMGEPHSVTAQMDTRYTQIESEDWIEANVDFGNGRTAYCAASVNSGQMRGGLTVKGTLGSITPAGITCADPARAAKANAAADAALPHTKQQSMAFVMRALRKVGRKLGMKQQVELVPHALLYRDIARAAAKGAPLPIPTSEALKSQQLCAGAYESAMAGAKVALPLSAQSPAFPGVSKDRYAARPPRPAAAAVTVPVLPPSKVVRVGLIGCDTTHAPTFAELLHNPYNGDHVPGARVVAAYPGGSPDMAASGGRVAGFTAELRDKYGVPIMATPEEVADASDVVFILSCDGRTHPGLFRSVAGRGKPVFIDKPIALSVADLDQIYEIARQTNTRIFASSAFRYSDGLVNAINTIRANGEKVTGCRVKYWGQIQPTQGRFFWYGIHGADMLLAVMGKGIKSVEATTVGDRDVIEVEHSDGRRSTMYGAHNDGTFQVSIDTDKRSYDIDAGGPIAARILATALDVLTPGGYARLWRASDAASVTGRAGRSVDPDAAETHDVIALLDAAERSYTSQQKVAL
jgi:predicted dehydrogenase